MTKILAANIAIAILLVIVRKGFAGIWWPFEKKGDLKKKGDFTDQTCSAESCQPLKLTLHHNGDTDNGREVFITREQCASSTPLSQLLCPMYDGPVDCTIHNSIGVKINDCKGLGEGEHVFIVSPGRLFMWPTFEIGHHAITEAAGKPGKLPITLETLSKRPRLFRVMNFFTPEESDFLIRNALQMTADDFRLKRSSTGAAGYHVDNFRTSENAFDTYTPIAMKIKHRAFQLLGIDPYDETLADGLQILRYNQTTAYVQHLDWIEPTPGSDHDFDSAGEGSNRYATILLYLSDVEDGGETVFSEASPRNEEFVTRSEAEVAASAYLEEKNLSHLFPRGSWQRNMVTDCRSRLSVKPKKAEAVLFYSQLPDGTADAFSIHGGCPVLQGTKWAANLWVWNGPRQGYSQKKSGSASDGGDEDEVEQERPENVKVQAVFEVRGVRGAELFWGDTNFGELVEGAPLAMNTFVGHSWTVRIGGDRVVATWEITSSDPNQRFVLEPQDLPEDLLIRQQQQ